MAAFPAQADAERLPPFDDANAYYACTGNATCLSTADVSGVLTVDVEAHSDDPFAGGSAEAWPQVWAVTMQGEPVDRIVLTAQVRVGLIEAQRTGSMWPTLAPIYPGQVSSAYARIEAEAFATSCFCSQLTEISLVHSGGILGEAGPQRRSNETFEITLVLDRDSGEFDQPIEGPVSFTLTLRGLAALFVDTGSVWARGGIALLSVAFKPA